MFNSNDFKVFDDPTLEGRLKKIREIIDPKFEIIGEELIKKYQPQFDEQLYVHVAKHARRHKNPPPDTWFAISTNKRGYKALPHIEIGLWPESFYLNLSFLAEIDDRQLVVDKLKTLKLYNEKLQISNDHTTSAMNELTEESLQHSLDKYLRTKNKDLVIGFRYSKDSFNYQTMEKDYSIIFDIFSEYNI
ncbi:UPF0637 protein [Companilactobacillus sp. RD055328]|uniref:DUF1054 family protein n=1 Tax=Companilactobacillus sp. RD055328 TaxID=2916634 RepID=UPI001FC8B51E|nr:DUF1054 family protein [Companilactobacillus sp. RD055328]GKQ42867.1 UPF0637 protein [Companilactobacillus sp. RD055328]